MARQVLKVILAAAAAAVLAVPVQTLAQTASDPLAGVASEISAVLDAATRPRLVLNQSEHGVNVRRELSVGEVYRDGWRLAGVAGGKVTFRKGVAERTIVLPDKVAEPPVAALAHLTGPVSLTNSLVGGTPGTHGLTSVSAAVTAGDADAARALGGGPEDILAAMMVKSQRTNDGKLAFLQQFEDTSDGSTITDGEMNGQPGLVKLNADGQPVAIVSGASTLTINRPSPAP